MINNIFYQKIFEFKISINQNGNETTKCLGC